MTRYCLPRAAHCPIATLRVFFSASPSSVNARSPSFLCSQLNEMAADDSPAENILIGTETSPKEIVAEPIECAGIGPAGERVSVRPTASGYYHWREGGSILHRPRGLRPGALSVYNGPRPCPPSHRLRR